MILPPIYGIYEVVRQKFELRFAICFVLLLGKCSSTLGGDIIGSPRNFSASSMGFNFNWISEHGMKYHTYALSVSTVVIST